MATISISLPNEDKEACERAASGSGVTVGKWGRETLQAVLRGDLVPVRESVPPEPERTPLKPVSNDMTISDDAALDLLTAGYLENDYTFNAIALEGAWRKLRDHLMGTPLEDRNKYIGVTGGVLDGRVINRG
jgi:hypothetical protein